MKYTRDDGVECDAWVVTERPDWVADAFYEAVLQYHPGCKDLFINSARGEISVPPCSMLLRSPDGEIGFVALQQPVLSPEPVSSLRAETDAHLEAFLSELPEPMAAQFQPAEPPVLPTLSIGGANA